MESQREPRLIGYKKVDPPPLRACKSVSERIMKVILRHKDLHAYGKICESVHKTASANKICKRKRSFVKV